jgi:hypothetical protein
MANNKFRNPNNEPEVTVTHFCGHVGTVIERCASAYTKRYCPDCTATLPKPSECLQRFMLEHNGTDHFGPMLGPVGAVIYARQSYFGISGMLAWSGSELMFEVIDGIEPTKTVTPYIQRFTEAGL